MTRYIIRRLTPTECARLQGFPDDWGHLAPYNPADAEFWEIVRKTHAEINGKVYKPVKNLKAWYEKLHNDGAEYKMWGNGIALPCAEYVLRGIAEEDEIGKLEFHSCEPTHEIPAWTVTHWMPLPEPPKDELKGE